MKHETILNELKKVEKKHGRKLIILEIGTIRDVRPEYADGDGHSTEHIANHIKGKGYSFYSVDIKIDVCKQYLKEKGFCHDVTLRQNDGLIFLNNYKGMFDFIYLDGANYADETLKQFLVAEQKLSTGGVIVIDDCFPESKDVVKCHDVLKHLKENEGNYFWRIENGMLIIEC